MVSIDKTHLCPVCGYDLGFPPWEGQSPSDEICPSCGIQFGYDDAAGGDLAMRTKVYLKWRWDWIRRGMPWSSAGRPQPPNWAPREQLPRIAGTGSDLDIGHGVDPKS